MNSIQEIARYITNELYSPAAAERITRMLYREIRALDELPARIGYTPEEPWHSKGVRRMVAGNYYVYFWIDEEQHIVHVTDVIDIRLDQIPRLFMMPIE